ncbi:DNA-dependent metalloprotease SPRTN [Nerophis ophidion]|uniref:DNA-dependent metalloprotease SPRTN n=1 Tax=Nerophis ophidion TaxID=159077 RepID=UPI002ADF3DFD|nr:DNA-dependent metalloprotease SPRTN [Nerophis ophidion]
MDNDYLLALHLQEQFNSEYDAPVLSSNDFGKHAKKQKVEVNGGALMHWERSVPPERPLSIVDPSWETLDPTPDVRAMFLQFNSRFFWGKLNGVEVKWSPRMTLCAGVCSYEGRGGLCSIRLSEPLLKLRPRKDLVETLLHEMIHALLFVTHNNRDRDGHGPEFCKHMKRINMDSGTNITVYHSFNDEVDVYRQHWWRCNGPCQKRKPYFGYVKRAMNRAPSSVDPWWGDHQRTCGGTYIKVKEPEGYGKNKSKKEAKQDRKTPAKEKPSGFVSQDIRDIIPFSGNGFVLGGKLSTSSGPSQSAPSTCVSKPLLPPFSPKSLHNKTGVGPFPLLGQKTAPKKSVGNTRVFVSINGSPLRISKPSCGSDKSAKQPSIEDLFNKSAKRLSLADSQSNMTAFASKNNNDDVITSSTQRPKSTLSVPSTSTAAGKTPRSKKRPLEDSSSIFDLFNKKLKSIDSKKTLTPSAPQASSASSSTFSSSSSSSSSIVVMVNCPVCQARVPETDVNQHLDSCLS